jgi:hypothetical protein
MDLSGWPPPIAEGTAQSDLEPDLVGLAPPFTLRELRRLEFLRTPRQLRRLRCEEGQASAMPAWLRAVLADPDAETWSSAAPLTGVAKEGAD